MESLTRIQKIFNVFKVLTKVAMIISIVWGVLALLGAACGMVWRNGGTVVGADFDVLRELTHTAALDEMTARLLSDAVFALTDVILFGFAYAYFRIEQEDGTPFTQKGADTIKKLGIRIIVLPLVAVVIAQIIYECFGVGVYEDWSDDGSVTLGIMLILVSMVFRYGAELEKK
ncbi:MAG: hypothetical protein ACI39Q_00735 [Wujia sp.]